MSRTALYEEEAKPSAWTCAVNGDLRFYDYERDRFPMDHEEIKRERANSEARARAEAEVELARLRALLGKD